MSEYQLKLNGSTIGYVIFQERFSDAIATQKMIAEGYPRKVKATFLRKI